MRKVFFAALLLAGSAAFGQSVIPNDPGVKPLVAIRNATIVPVTSAPIPNGTIVFGNGVITAVGANVAVPANATVIDGTGLFVYPGMIDASSSVGLTEIDSVPGTVDTTELGDFNANASAAVAINPHSELIPVTRVNGVTNIVTVPEGGIISGQSALIQLAGWTPQEMVIKSPAAMNIRFPRLRSGDFGDVPQDEEAEKNRRKTYAAEIDKLRDVFRDAQAYARAASARASNKDVHRFDRDLILEALVPVVEGREPVVMHANLARDIRAALAFADEFNLKVILSGAQDVAEVIPDLKQRNIPVLLGPTLALPQREDDPYDLLFTNAKTLLDNGILFAIKTDEAHNTRNLPYHAAACAAFGLPKDEALKAITIYPARIFGVADRLGSLEVGKIANVIITDGDPLELRTNVKRVFINGEDISMQSRHTLLYDKFRNRPRTQ
ncbi:MAG: amidohydrolase family protein [Acidobacteria bacterium]|nr:amidohydrolase family protein [Acidobacteriota bacterium]MBV9477404.1 amidohydrolase family protein [Acidobacteriota bacterium]